MNKKYDPIKLTNATGIIIIIGFVSAFLYSVLFNMVSEKGGHPFVDGMFVIGMILFLIGGIELVYENGLFNAPKYFFRKVIKKKKNKEPMDMEDPINTMSLVEYISHRPKGFFLTIPMVLGGLLLAVISYIISIAVIL